MALHDEIQERRAEIRSDGYPMSIGELVNLYRDGELNVHPEFQRFFRWTAPQKARLIESLLLGIPLPSVFVSQREDGVWDVIDGLQRLSTIFEFIGVLKDGQDNCVPPLVLMGTKYLPSLANRTWRDNGAYEGIGSENQLIIKRSKIDIKIVLRESSEESKYELFQRLNMGGSQLSAQELRNVLMIPEFGEFLTESMLGLASAGEPGREAHRMAFVRTFEILAQALEDDSFRRYDHQRRRHLGRFLISAFEVIAMGLGFNVSKPGYRIDPGRVRTVARNIWRDETFRKAIGSGVGTSSRIPVTIPGGRALFA